MTVEGETYMVVQDTEWFIEDDPGVRECLQDPQIEYRLILTHVEPICESDYFYVYDYIYVPADWDEQHVQAAVLRSRIDGTKVFNDG